MGLFFLTKAHKHIRHIIYCTYEPYVIMCLMCLMCLCAYVKKTYVFMYKKNMCICLRKIWGVCLREGDADDVFVGGRGKDLRGESPRADAVSKERRGGEKITLGMTIPMYVIDEVFI